MTVIALAIFILTLLGVLTRLRGLNEGVRGMSSQP